jgi:hypothetical protein
MKKIIFTLLLGATITMQAQEQTVSTTVIEIYGTTNGIKNMTPNKVLVQQGNTTEVYDVQNGIQSFTPEKIIIDNNVYNVTNGIRDLVPEAIIEKDDESN